MIYRIFFCLILFLAIFLRLYNLESNPPSLNWDEISLGYNAYSILNSGRDEWGQTLPPSFRAYGDYKLPAYVYIDAPFIALFGLNAWGVRLPSALAGILTVVFIFLIIKEVTKNKTVPLLGMFIAAILPWHIILSRIALEANLALFLLTSGIFFMLFSFRKGKYLLVSALLFGISLFTYNSSRVVVLPLILLSAFLFFRKFRVSRKTSLISLAIITAFFLIALPLALLQDSSARYRWTQILDEGAINRINELRGSSTLPPLAKELVINKITYFIPEVMKGYLSHFSIDFLFINGSSNYQYSVPGSGLILWVMLPLLLLGFTSIFKSKDKSRWFILGWLLISPVPAAITRDFPHGLRSLFLIPPLVIISSLGLELVFERTKRVVRPVVVGLVIVAGLANLIFFWHNYTNNYRVNYSWSWQYGYKDVVSFIKQNESKYDRVVITKKYGEPHEFLLFYLQYNPKLYQQNPSLIRYAKSDWFWVDGFDKYVFVNDWEIKDRISSEYLNKGKSLIVTSPGNYPEGLYKIKTVGFLDGKDAFDILESN